MAQKKRPEFSCEDPDVLRLAKEQLSSSGLSLEDAKDLGIDVLSASAMQTLGYNYNQPGLLFRYYDLETGEFTPLNQFHRVRLLGSPKGFGAQVKKQPRYFQPTGSLNMVYVPRTVGGTPFDWTSYAKGSEELYITEGEKKAAIACKKGIPCIALGGVEMWRANTRGAGVLPSFDLFNWRNRNVNIIFDTDTPTGLKDDVLRAAHSLMDYLLSRGAIPTLAILPPSPDGTKVALDDFLLKFDKSELEKQVVQSHGVPHVSAKLLCELAEKYVYIDSISKFIPRHVLDGSISNPIPKEKLDEILRMRKVPMPVPTSIRQPGGGVVVRPQLTPTSASTALLMFEASTKCTSMVYRPGRPKIIEEHDRYLFNLWEGWCCEYEDDTYKLPSIEKRNAALARWSWALDNLFGDEPKAREFIEHWLFYPIKHPGAKLNTLVLLTSIQQGIGKTFIGDMLARFIYGIRVGGPQHASKIKEGRLEESFNSYMYAKSFVLGDDIAAQHKNGVYKQIMSMVTSEDIEVNLKNVQQFNVENCVNFWLTSNDPSPFFMSDNDRRALVHIPRRAIKNSKMYDELKEMFELGIAGPALLWYARERYDDSMFDPNADAPWTSAKSEVVVNSKGQLRDWLEGLIACAAAGELSRPCASSREIMALLEVDDSRLSTKSNDRGMGLMLAESGAIYYRDGKQISIKNNSNGTTRRERVWILADPMRIANMTEGELSNYMALTPFKHATRKEDPPSSVVQIKRNKLKGS